MLILTASAAVTGEAAVRVLKDQEYTTSAEAASKAAKTVKRGSHRVRLSCSGSGWMKAENIPSVSQSSRQNIRITADTSI